jgi:hypothetical protein
MRPHMKSPSFLFAALFLAGCSGNALDAGTTYTLASSTPPTTRATLSARIGAITMDETNLYFTCEDGWVYRASKAGPVPSSPEKIASAGSAAANGLVYTGGIAVDDTNVYWTADATGVGDGTLYSAPKGGGSSAVLASSQSFPRGVAVDAANIYWVDQAVSPPSSDLAGIGAGTVQVLAKGGGRQPTTLAAGLTAPDFIALDGAGNALWHDATGINRVPIGGGPSEVLVVENMANVSNLVVADGTVFWGADDDPYAIDSASTAGGGAVTLAANVAKPAAVAALGASVYWNDADGASVDTVIRVPSSGGTPTPLGWPTDSSEGADNHEAAFLLLDAQAFYAVEYSTSPELTVVVRTLPHS